MTRWGQTYVILVGEHHTASHQGPCRWLAILISWERKIAKSVGSRVRGLLRNVAETLGYANETAENQSTDPEKIALGNIARNLTVNREDVASVITIAFSSSDPRQGGSDR